MGVATKERDGKTVSRYRVRHVGRTRPKGLEALRSSAGIWCIGYERETDGKPHGTLLNRENILTAFENRLGQPRDGYIPLWCRERGG